MKKVFTLLMIVGMTLISFASNKHKIVIDKMQDDTRVVEAKGTKIGGFTSTKLLFIGLQTWTSPNDTTFVVITNVIENSNFPLGAMNNAIMLIKTMDDEVIELNSVLSENNSQKVSLGNPTITISRWKNRINTIYNSNSVNVSKNINYWYITPDIIEKLKGGVKKVKIQFQNGIYEKEFKKDEIGHVLYESYLVEIEHVNNTTIVDNFKNGF